MDKNLLTKVFGEDKDVIKEYERVLKNNKKMIISIIENSKNPDDAINNLTQCIVDENLRKRLLIKEVQNISIKLNDSVKKIQELERELREERRKDLDEYDLLYMDIKDSLNRNCISSDIITSLFDRYEKLFKYEKDTDAEVFYYMNQHMTYTVACWKVLTDYVEEYTQRIIDLS